MGIIKSIIDRLFYGPTIIRKKDFYYWVCYCGKTNKGRGGLPFITVCLDCKRKYTDGLPYI